MEEQKDASVDLTAFTTSLRSLRQRYRTAEISPNEFQRKISRCSLSACRGMCCYDGASVDHDTGMQVQELADDRRSAFTAMGLNLPDKVIEHTEWNGMLGLKTVTRPFPYRLLVEHYPAHFKETACVFLLEDGRCGLQLLSTQEGKHPWYYKPFTCWLQPIKLSDSKIRLYDDASDPNKLPGYDGFVSRTQCGRNDDCGGPAAEILREELRFLGILLDRDFLSELTEVKTTAPIKISDNTEKDQHSSCLGPVFS